MCSPFSPNRVLPYNMSLTQKGGAVSGEMIVTGTIRDSMKLATDAKSFDATVPEAAQRWLRRTGR
jgi:hypothetical protein